MATYNIARFVRRILTPYAKKAASYTSNTKELLEELQNINIDSDEVLVSFDVKSLYTSVPAMEAATAIREIINDDDLFEDHNEMTPDTFMEIVKLCLTTACLQFRGEHYELTDGLAMGSPASPCIANIYMDKFERNALDTFNGPPPKTWWRYVDDVLSVMKRRAVDELLRHLN